MTVIYLIIGLLFAMLFVATLVVCFKSGEASGIAKYGYVEEEKDELSENN